MVAHRGVAYLEAVRRIRRSDGKMNTSKQELTCVDEWRRKEMERERRERDEGGACCSVGERVVAAAD